MKSNYKKLGNYIQIVDNRNIEAKEENLLGVSVSKVFMKSIANTVGTDFTTYRIVKRNQFTYIPDTSRRGDKIGVALLEDYNEGLVSQAYTVFEVIDENKLLPQYLMMWFRRPEFDRYARYMSYGSVREIFSWEEMCNMQVPIPSIEKQREIVAEYKIIQDRIALNNQLIAKLEDTAQAIYKQWFVDFEFPDETGKPYKSNGGEMVESELGEIPKGWNVISVKEFCRDMKSGGTPSRDNVEYWNSKDIAWLKTGEISNNIIIGTEEFISLKGLKESSAKLLPKDTVLMSMYGVNAGDIGILKVEATTNQACCGMICDNPHNSAYLYFHLLYNQSYISSQAIGGAQENLSKDFIEKIPMLQPIKKEIEQSNLKIIINNKEVLTKEISIYNKLMDLLLARLATIGD